MTSQAEALYHLQTIDLDMLRTHKRLKAIDKEMSNDAAIAQAKQHVEEAEDALSPIRTKMRDTEMELQSNTEKANSAEARLYDGSVTNTKEMQDLQQEVESLKRRNTSLEERLLEQMEQIEQKEQTLQARKDELRAVTEERKDEFSELLQEQNTLQQQMNALREKRAEALKPINDDDYETYKSMRKKKANQPVAILKGDSCSVCGMVQTVAVAQAVRRRDDLIECENCGRILADII
jgi:uncharacterized protein